jgi:hypothetical protein
VTATEIAAATAVGNSACFQLLIAWPDNKERLQLLDRLYNAFLNHCNTTFA